MSFLSHIGAGLSGLSTGFARGAQLGKAWNELSNEADIREIRENGLAGAQEQRDADIAGAITVGTGKRGEPVYMVGGQSYDDEGAAKAAAEKAVDPLSDYYTKSVFPKMYEAYVGQGDMEKATAWQQFHDQQTTKTAMRYWSAAAKAAAQGDHAAFGQNLVKLYNTTGYYEDGLEAKSADPVLDGDGNLLGYKVELLNKKTGQTTTQTFSGQDDLLNAGLSALSPEQALEYQWSQKVEADKAAAAAAASDADFNRKVQLLGLGHQFDLERDAYGATLDAKKGATKAGRELEAKLGVLRGFGFSDDEIKGMVPELVGAGTYRKGAPPADVRRSIWETLAKNDLSGKGFTALSPDEQSKAVDEVYKVIQGQGEAAPVGPQAGLPAPAAPTGGAGGGVPVLDTKTGQIVYR